MNKEANSYEIFGLAKGPNILGPDLFKEQFEAHATS
jgi:hypothetical protein